MSTKALKTQLLAAIAMVLVAGIALGSSTYAWFASNNQVTAQGMTVNATADASLVIKGTQDNSFGSVGTNKLEAKTLKPSTSYDGKNFGKLAAGVKVESSGDEKATWTGTSGAFQSADLELVDAADTYYATTEYTIKSLVENANVYVKSITLGGTGDNIDDALRISVTIGSTTYVYNAGGGTNSGEGVGKYDATTWTLAAASYTTADDNTKTFSLVADTEAKATINIWYEGQDTNCFSENVTTNDKTITIEFAKA